MDFPWIQFIILLFLITLGVSLILRFFMFQSADGAVKRLKEDIDKANTLQMELGQKLKVAEQELSKKQAEARALADKMKSDAEESSKSEREKIIANARLEGEEIIAKAQGSKLKIAEDLERTNDMRVVGFSMQVLNDILSQKAKAALDDVLTNEFLQNLINIDMSRISQDIASAEVITLIPITDNVKNQLSKILKDKMKRDITIKSTVDANLGGGVILKFGSMALDGSVRNLIRESGTALMQKVAVK